MLTFSNSLDICELFRIRSACLIILVVVAQIHLGSTTGYQQQQTSGNGEINQSGPVNYMFKYAVQAGQYDNEFGHEEERNGKQTRGQYRVKLPDGRLQIVTYTADENGYKADVTYQPASGFGGGSGNRNSPSDSYGASSNNMANSGGYGQSQPQSQSTYQNQDQGQSYGTPTNAWQNQGSAPRAGSNSGSFMMQRRKINGRMYSFETKY